jgi:hypothetical protein
MADETVIQWHNDGHFINLILSKSNLLIDSVECPADDTKDSPCRHESIDGCAVRWFISRYGFDCNVGVVPVESRMQIAWTLVAESLYDPELWQVWIIPTADEVFSAWVEAQNGDSSSEVSETEK